jgi:hypothetical protein
MDELTLVFYINILGWFELFLHPQKSDEPSPMVFLIYLDLCQGN